MLIRAAATLAGTLLIGLPAFAQELIVEQQVERVIVIEDEEGGLEMELLPAEEVKPGEQLFYSVTYSNPGETPARDAVLTLPVPADVSLLEDSAMAEYDQASVDFSMDGGATYVPREKLIAESGLDEIQPVSVSMPEEITHMRWTFNREIGPKDSGKIFFAAVLKENTRPVSP
ncbi:MULTISPECIES: DUF11 domain-containing protein [unclassified Hyphomonas]|mgnify:FL=1|jgi:uncharacterized repeat protein (TIGR01451 family)|uniref:DUF11 domain-containing protein n=1 Tax=hydrothermal vent metagenome TaxID=652676 RepID=A0A170PTZ9_9ZZZZ|nr:MULTISPECIES: DUF11 domain-containing protein [unclassified Hyphomonas]MAL43975.1 hypothetical protein [Hyphomonas sp.]MAX84363.1 hypothetical protein [Hyphomonas sp.]MDF1806753.1 DUF11 domain-containing protein [Hyphomonas sp.]QSR20912.1 hypothetical protein CFA77_01240 [Hyphomonas sp. KY3]RCL88836.1 MAG: DUF11 domain-containing protein [Hyphomonas sp.]|tara:strand:- start:5533 stop:6051 length:519 start_codon:yes stop_codon:yes gene_type:complete